MRGGRKRTRRNREGSAIATRFDRLRPVDVRDEWPRIREETGLPVCIADDPLCCVVLGTSQILGNFKLLPRIEIE